MKKVCPDCGHSVAQWADECPHCACWMDVESSIYLRSIFFITYFLTFGGVIWVLHQDPVSPDTQPPAPDKSPITEQSGAPKP